MKRLSEKQQQAVRHLDGPAMVLAGPGSGKTTVITSRVRYLIEHQVRPEHILVITFTKAAAREMEERFSLLTNNAPYHVTFGTFHAIFFQILKHAYGYTAGSILREEDRYRIVLEAGRGLNMESGDMREWAGDVLAEISRVKEERIPIDCYYSASTPEEAFREIYAAYRRRQEELRKIDFDDMCLYTADLFHNRPDILKGWQDRFRYILVDEFQDINPLQYRVVQMLSGERKNLFIVGDDDQSIYRFRGSRPQIMLNFPSDFPGSRIIQLVENYRSTPAIVAASLRVISENKNRYRKQLCSVETRGEPIEVMECADMETEMLYLVKSVRKSLTGGLLPSDIAVLTRTNAESREPFQRLSEFQIPCRVKDTGRILWDHWIAQDLIAYLALGKEEMERKDFLRVCNRPNRYITRKSAYGSRITFEGLRAYYADQLWMMPYLDSFEDLLGTVRPMRPYAALNYIRKGGGYDGFLQDYAASRKIDVSELLQLADEIQDTSRGCRTLEEWLEKIRKSREEMEEAGRSSSSQPKQNGGCVTMATLHGAKGLEFTEVFLLNVNEGMIPYHRAVMEEELEEERRLFYVGMTRAKRKLHILYVKERYNRRMQPSRFLEALHVPKSGGSHYVENHVDKPVEKQGKNKRKKSQIWC